MVTALHPLITYEMCGTHTGPFEVVLRDPEARPRCVQALVGGPSLGVIQTSVQSPNLSLISLVIWSKWGKIGTIRPTSRAAVRGRCYEARGLRTGNTIPHLPHPDAHPQSKSDLFQCFSQEGARVQVSPVSFLEIVFPSTREG